MDGSIDLSFEAIDDINNIPSTKGMGWVASELKRENWTVALNTSAIEEIASIVKQTASKPLPTLLLKPEQFEIPELTQLSKTIYVYKGGVSISPELISLALTFFLMESFLNHLTHHD